MACPSLNIVLEQPVTVGEYFEQVRNSQIHQNVQISCSNGRLLENQMMVGCIFYNILKEVNFGLLSDSVLIMPEYTVEEVTSVFNRAYAQTFHGETTKTIDHSKFEYFEVKLEPEDEHEENVVDDAVNRRVIQKEMKYFCKECEFSAHKIDQLKRHMERKHTLVDVKSTTYACEDCPYTSNIYKVYQRHKKNQPPCNAKSEKCLFCEKSSLTKQACKKHMRRYHEVEWKQYKNKYAAMKTDNQDENKETDLSGNRSKKHIERKHLLDLDNSTIHTFDACNDTSKINKNFLKQKKNKHGSKVKTVKCLFCDNKSLTKDASRKHMQRNHKEEWEQCKNKNKVRKLIVSEMTITDQTEANI